MEILEVKTLKLNPTDAVNRALLPRLPLDSRHAVVLAGVRRCGKSTLQAQLRNRAPAGIYCNFEDPRIFGMQPTDFPLFLATVNELGPAPTPVFLDEIQELPEWQRLARSLLDRGHALNLTGSNASLLGRELGTKLTGRHLSFEVYPFNYSEYLAFTGGTAGPETFSNYLDDGGFPGYLRERRPEILRELFRDIIQRDIAHRHGLRETRHLMNLGLHLLANTGQPNSFQRLSKILAIPTVGQTSRYMEYLEDAYLIMSLPRYSPSFKQRVVSPGKYYAIDNGLRRQNSPQANPDSGHRLENAVYLALRHRGGAVYYATETDRWECDFVTAGDAIQVCYELSPTNTAREIAGLVGATRQVPSRIPRILTFNQEDRIRQDGLEIDVQPAWKWLLTL